MKQLELQDVHLRVRSATGAVAHILRGVSLEVNQGSVVGLVGESGCGKTMMGRSILRLLPMGSELSGRIEFAGANLVNMTEKSLRTVRGKRISMIFQDPSAALNPVFTIGDQLLALLKYHQIAPGTRQRSEAHRLLTEVGLPDPPRILGQYPHELSGGMQQRALIAMALATNPDLLIADEPTTSLDVTVEAQILDLLLHLRASRGLTVLLITHNMRVITAACERVAVLYLGRVVEEGPVAGVLERPQHPYTQALMSALPASGAWREPLQIIHGLLPNVTQEIEGCVFASRCPHVMPVCASEPPVRIMNHEGKAACWLHVEDRESVDVA